MQHFDPFTATMAEAQAQPQPEPYDSHRDPIMLWGMAQNINAKRSRFEQYPIEGVSSCVRFGLIAPDWLARAFVQQYDQVLNCRVATWDEAFGPAHPGKGKNHLSTLRLCRTYGRQLEQLFNGPYRLRLTLKGRTQAARILGITEKQVRNLLPTKGNNVKGHKPYRAASMPALSANDPFSLAPRKTPKS